MHCNKFILLAVLCFVFKLAEAQDTQEADSVETPDMVISYAVMPSIEWASVPEDYFVHAGLEAGISLNNNYHISVHGMKMMGKLTRRVVFPNIYEYDYYETGGILGYTLYNHQKLYLIGESHITYATAKWVDISENKSVLKDSFWVFKPGIRVEYNMARVLGIGGRVNYRMAEEIVLSGIQNDEYNGITASLYLKIGLLR